MAPSRIAVIIPALDEEASIGLVLAEIPPLVSEVIVVDNGSTDGTAAADAEVIAFLDADHSDHPDQLAAVVAPILAGDADLVIGSRTLGRRAPGAHPWHAVLGTRLCVALMNALVGTRATDLGPFRAITAAALRRLEMRDCNFGWTVEMQVKAARRGLRVREVPVDYRPRIGSSKISGTVSGSVRAGAKILGTIARHALAR